MKTKLLAASAAALVCLAGAGHADDMTLKPYTEVRVTQLRPGETFPGPLQYVAACKATPKPAEEERTKAAPLVAAIGGIIINWLFERGAGVISKRVKEKIKQYTISFANEPVYIDMFNKDMWMNNESCVVVERLHCKVPEAAIKIGHARCKDTDNVGISVGIRLRREDNLLRVLPYAEELLSLDPKIPKHDGGEVSVAVTFRIEAIGRNADGSGYPWRSQDIVIASMGCEAPESLKKRWGKKSSGEQSPQRAVTNCRKDHLHGLDMKEAWQYAHVLPMPPATRQAFVFTVAEVGEPSRGLEIFQEFFDATGDDLSAALSEALQRKIKLTNDD